MAIDAPKIGGRYENIIYWLEKYENSEVPFEKIEANLIRLYTKYCSVDHKIKQSNGYYSKDQEEFRQFIKDTWDFCIEYLDLHPSYVQKIKAAAYFSWKGKQKKKLNERIPLENFKKS